MTRETKIGLLVGLAFIIVIGILLSDHLSSTTEPLPAALAQAGPNVRSAVNSPGTENAEPPITNVATPASVQPAQPVPTREELVNRPPAAPAIVRIGPAAEQQPTQQVITVNNNTPSSPAAPEAQATPVASEQHDEIAGADKPTIAPGPMQEVARQFGEELVSANGSSGSARTYVAQPGDTLSKIAGRLMGANTKSNREAIMRANPSLAGDPNKIIAGKSYNIPGGAAAPAAVIAEVPNAGAAPAASMQQPSSSPEYWYTTKEGDSLWRIAQEQLGDGNAYASIKELNKDILGGSDTIRPDMKLRLPAKPIASAQ